jgi:hypothetical protein
MLQQAAKFMFKTIKQIHQGKKAEGPLSYFNDIESLLNLKSSVKSADDLLNLQELDNALAVRSAFKIKNTM